MSRKHSSYEKYYFKISRILRHSKQNKDWYVETNYHLFAAIPLIREAFPDALVFHIIRDGRDVVTSWLNRYRYITNNHMTPFHIHGDPAQDYWGKWNPLQKLSWYWKSVNNRVAQTGADMVIRFEDLFINNKNLIFDILDRFDGVDYIPEQAKKMLEKKVNLNKKSFFPKYDQWPNIWKEQFWEIAGKDMEMSGYKCDL